MFAGFGDVGLETNFWLGLEPVHQLSSNGGYTRMRVEMYANDSRWYSADYQHFSVGNASTGYRLTVSGYSGDAGDHLWASNNVNSRLEVGTKPNSNRTGILVFERTEHN